MKNKIFFYILFAMVFMCFGLTIGYFVFNSNTKNNLNEQSTINKEKEENENQGTPSDDISVSEILEEFHLTRVRDFDTNIFDTNKNIILFMVRNFKFTSFNYRDYQGSAYKMSDIIGAYNEMFNKEYDYKKGELDYDGISTYKVIENLSEDLNLDSSCTSTNIKSCYFYFFEPAHIETIGEFKAISMKNNEIIGNVEVSYEPDDSVESKNFKLVYGTRNDNSHYIISLSFN